MTKGCESLPIFKYSSYNDAIIYEPMKDKRVHMYATSKCMPFIFKGVTLSLLLLGIGFQVANIDTPTVTWHPQNDCDKYKDCGSCTYDTNCGFCYVIPENEGIAMNGSCVTISSESQEYASIGRY